MKILFVAAELAPLAKVGGVADVVGSLPKIIRRLGHDVRILIPAHAVIDEQKYTLTTVATGLKVLLKGQEETFSLKTTTLGPDVPVYLISNNRYFSRISIYGEPDDLERFLFFCRAALEVPKWLEWQPDVVHCHDWETALLLNFIKTDGENHSFYRNTASVFTIHNLAYQGVFDRNFLVESGLVDNLLQPLVYGRRSDYDMISQGILYADVFNTVSETYAREILTPEYSEGLEAVLRYRKRRLFGILNGIDYQEFDPRTDPNIAVNYDASTIEKRASNKAALQLRAGLPADPSIPLLAVISRLTYQKGIDLAAEAMETLLPKTEAQFLLLGVGDKEYQRRFVQLAQDHPSKAAIFLAFDPSLAKLIYAGCDLFLMPSRWEPCGLGQLIALRYGAIPVVRRTGGLADTVWDYDPNTGEGNGFVFGSYRPEALYDAITRALEVFHRKEAWFQLVRKAMSCDYSWEASAKKYETLYEKALAFKQLEDDL